RRFTLCVVGAIGAALTVIWGPLLAHFMVLDAVATRAATLYGMAAGIVTTGSAVLLVWWRLRRPVSSVLPLHASLDLSVSGAVSAIAIWGFAHVDPRIPAFEGLSLLCLYVAFASGGGLIIYVLMRARVAPATVDTRQRMPSIHGLFIYGTAVLALFTAVLLGFGTAGRSAGARDQLEGEALSNITDLLAAALAQTKVPGSEVQILDLLETDPMARAELRPPGTVPPMVRDETWMTDDRRVVLSGGHRWHVVRRTIDQGVLWVHAPANVRPPVRAPEDTPVLLLLAFLLLIAPLGTGLFGRDLVTRLAHVAGELRAMGPAAPTNMVPQGVAVEINDEVGEVAAALNRLCRRFSTETSRLADDLAAAEAADSARDKFLTASSQGLRTPLNRIAAHCQVLQAETRLTPAQKEDLEAISSSTQQLLGHVGDILKLTALDAGDEDPLALQPVDLGELVRTVMRAHAQAFAPGVVPAVHVVDGLPIAMVDPHRIRQVVANLISNSAKFTRDGHVEAMVSLARAGTLKIEVADSGPGIPAAELEQIFIEFHRVEAQRDVPGTGLGLAISRRIVERHGGVLWAESQLGEGSKFTLMLPVAS
ncbi:MAG: signal transduction histidine kinase, partial [Bradymonadia bacterium]